MAEGSRESDSSLAPDQWNAQPEAKESCVKYFDALWFCYSPVYQVREYYREGEFDSCLGKFNDVVDCLLLRTAAEERIKAKRLLNEQKITHMWSMRNPEEASEFWNREFGYNSTKES